MGRQKTEENRRNDPASKRNWKGRLLKHSLLLACLFVFIGISAYAMSSIDSGVSLSEEEKIWLSENSKKTFLMGLDLEAGIESFSYEGRRVGYIYDYTKDLKKDLGLNIKVAENLSWNESLVGLKEKKVDILLGANKTAEREAYMLFTKSMREVPYVVFAKKDSTIQNIGDISGKKVAFLKGDSVSNRLKEQYSRVEYTPIVFEKYEDGMQLLIKGQAEAVIISGGEVTYEYLHNYPTIVKVCNIERVKSSMSMVTLKENRVLWGILDKYISYEENTGRLPSMIKTSLRLYIQKVLELTKEELDWLKYDGRVVFGVTEDYLPFDYFKDGEFKGINGAICEELSDLMGFRSVYKSGDFAELLNLLIRRDIDVLSVAKTEERESKMLFTTPYIDDRDRIFGKTETPSIFDIGGLKGKKVAVINGYYQIDMLKKNNIGADLVYFDDIIGCIKAVHSGRADYLIENQQVLNYYASELGIYDILEKGITAEDTRLYFGVSKDKPELVSILNKAIPLIDVDGAMKKGLESVPRKKNLERYKNLLLAIGGLVLLLGGIGIILNYLFVQLLKEKTQKELLIQKEELLYRDSLTGIYNRNYYNDKIRPKMDHMMFPQAILVFDLNNLKDINDTYGHYVGDLVLAAFGKAIKEETSGQMGVRFGGDEFVVFLFGNEAEKAGELAESICKRAETAANDIPSIQTLKCGCAKGYSLREDRELSIDEFFRQADKNMYEDKNYKRSKA